MVQKDPGADGGAPDQAATVSRWRVLLTVFGTLMVIGLEFVLLFGVYQRAVPVADQRVLVADLAGELSAAGSDDAAALAASTRTVADALAAAGLSDDDVAALQRAADVAATDPGAAALTGLRSAVDALAADLADEAGSLDLQAAGAYSAMLVVASVGWMVWFRRLVSRHRRLQAEFTEQEARAASEGRLASLVRNSADVILVLEPDATVRYATDSVVRVFDAPPADLLGHPLHERVLPTDAELLVALLAASREGDQDVRFRVQRADGSTRHVEGTLTNLLADPGVGGLVLTVRDVSSRVELEQQLTHQALHDPLTGLSNRRLFSDRLDHALRRRSGGVQTLTLLFCDLDDFKDVNDRFGHGVGDQLLTEVGRRLAAVAREGDTVARLGGDEFALLLEETPLADAHAVAARVHEVLAAPFAVDGHELGVRASIGLADVPESGITGADLLRNADVAVYLAKDAKSTRTASGSAEGGTAVYEPHLHSQALERLQLRADLQQAIDGGELVLFFQPTVDLADVDVAGFEALVRWQHPTRGLVPPLEFIPLAETSGLIVPLGTWVLREACRAAVTLQRPGHRPVSMSVNVSVQQLTAPGFVGLVSAALADSGLPARLLVLELTESALLADPAAVAPSLVALRETGIRIAIDDFGTGYSSLSYLRDLPVDVLKVDKSFVDHVLSDEQGASLTEAIIAMSQSLHLTTVAEGVEDAGQAAWLTAAGASYGQGYLWSKPVPLAAARQLLEHPVAPPVAPTAPAAPRVPAAVPESLPG